MIKITNIKPRGLHVKSNTREWEKQFAELIADYIERRGYVAKVEIR